MRYEQYLLNSLLAIALAYGILFAASCALRENCAYYQPVPHGSVIYYHCRDVRPPGEVRK